SLFSQEVLQRKHISNSRFLQIGFKRCLRLAGLQEGRFFVVLLDVTQNITVISNAHYFPGFHGV
uniref:Uncharacterized protein n=1 Tax=Aegilops tauschii subsp. strangulata TaxID=200361 RepID=A0A453H8H4_AEGTS